ncbi:hypothetical protein CFRS1_v014944 [Colletotrichum fructicola]|nr:hypothetical protein CFRS1_v014944 [Colletotrichum fructicola]
MLSKANQSYSCSRKMRFWQRWREPLLLCVWETSSAKEDPADVSTASAEILSVRYVRKLGGTKRGRPSPKL